MKIKCISAMAILLLSGATTINAATHVGSCSQDVKEMWTEIGKWGSLTSQDWYQFDRVGGSPQPKGENLCTTPGYQYGHFVCDLVWEKGNWGNTFHCE